MIAILFYLVSTASACSPLSLPCRIDTSYDRAEITNLRTSAPKALKIKTVSTYATWWKNVVEMDILKGEVYMLFPTDDKEGSVVVEGRRFDPGWMNPATKTLCRFQEPPKRELKIAELRKQRWNCEEEHDTCGGSMHGLPFTRYHHGKSDRGWSAKQRAPTNLQPEHMIEEFLVNGRLETVEYDVANVLNPKYLNAECDAIPEHAQFNAWRTVPYDRNYAIKYRLEKADYDSREDDTPNDSEDILRRELREILDETEGIRPPKGAVLARLRNALGDRRVVEINFIPL